MKKQNKKAARTATENRKEPSKYDLHPQGRTFQETNLNVWQREAVRSFGEGLIADLDIPLNTREALGYRDGQLTLFKRGEFKRITFAEGAAWRAEVEILSARLGECVDDGPAYAQWLGDMASMAKTRLPAELESRMLAWCKKWNVKPEEFVRQAVECQLKSAEKDSMVAAGIHEEAEERKALLS